MTITTPYRAVYIGDGIQTDYATPASYIRRSHISATVDGVAASFTWFSDTIIRFDSPPGNGTEIVILRSTPTSAPIHSFTPPTRISDTALNENFQQSLQATEEVEFAQDLAEQASADAADALIAANLALSQVGDAVNAVIPDLGVTTAKLANDAVTTAKILDGAVTADKIADGVIGSLALGAGAVGTATLADNAVTSPKILNGAITENKIANGAVTTDKLSNVSGSALANGTVTSAKLASSAITEAKLGAGAVTTSKMGNDSVTTDKLTTSAVTSNKIANGAVTEEKLANDAVTTAKIANGTVTAAKLDPGITFSVNDGSIGTAQLANGAVTSAKLAAGAVTSASLAAGSVEFSQLSSSLSTNNGLGSFAFLVKVSGGTATWGQVVGGNELRQAWISNDGLQYSTSSAADVDGNWRLMGFQCASTQGNLWVRIS